MDGQFVAPEIYQRSFSAQQTMPVIVEGLKLKERVLHKTPINFSWKGRIRINKQTIEYQYAVTLQNRHMYRIQYGRLCAVWCLMFPTLFKDLISEKLQQNV